MPETFRRAFAAGYDYVELDVRRTKDGVLVIHHDPATEDGRPVSSLTWSQYQAQLQDDTLTFRDLITLATQHHARLHVDIKEPGFETEIVELLLAHLTPEDFVITSDDATVRSVKTRFPQVQAGLSLGEDLDHATPWRRLKTRLSELFPAARIKASRADFVAVDHRLARAHVLSYCRRAHIPAWVWTVDQEAQITRCLSDDRVSVLITNHPDLARRLGRQPEPTQP